MARGSIVWRCPICGTKTGGACEHEGGRYAIIYLTQEWDAEQGRISKRQKWETAPLSKSNKPNKKLAETLLAKRLNSVHEGTYRELKESTWILR